MRFEKSVSVNYIWPNHVRIVVIVSAIIMLACLRMGGGGGGGGGEGEGRGRGRGRRFACV